MKTLNALAELYPNAVSCYELLVFGRRDNIISIVEAYTLEDNITLGRCPLFTIELHK